MGDTNLQPEPGAASMEGFCAEHDDVLISIQRILISESERLTPAVPPTIEVPVEPPILIVEDWDAPACIDEEPAPEVPEARPVGRALTRNLMLEQALPPAWRAAS
jgi:hypothetical protein